MNRAIARVADELAKLGISAAVVDISTSNTPLLVEVTLSRQYYSHQLIEFIDQLSADLTKELAIVVHVNPDFKDC